METIGIADFEKLVMARLENPSSFENETLVLWHQRCYPHNLPERIIEDCCVRFNQVFPGDQAWFKRFSGPTGNYSEIKEFCPKRGMSGFKNHGILLDDGGTVLDSNIDEWLRFVNTHINSFGHLSSLWPMIAYANNPRSNTDDFGENCTLYHFQPSIDEWYDWFKPLYPAFILDPIVDYMRAKGLSTDSYAWESILYNAKHETKHTGVEDLKQLTRNDCNEVFHDPLYPDSLVEDLWGFIHKQD